MFKKKAPNKDQNKVQKKVQALVYFKNNIN